MILLAVYKIIKKSHLMVDFGNCTYSISVIKCDDHLLKSTAILNWTIGRTCGIDPFNNVVLIIISYKLAKTTASCFKSLENIKMALALPQGPHHRPCLLLSCHKTDYYFLQMLFSRGRQFATFINMSRLHQIFQSEDSLFTRKFLFQQRAVH